MSDRAKVLFFANLREKTGVREASISFPKGTKISDLKNLLVEMYPNLKPNMETIIVAMNHEFAFDEYVVQDGAEIALFPPVSGGGRGKEALPIVISLVDREIDMNDLVAKISDESTGAVCLFSGIVRGITKRGIARETEALQYEAYQAMALLKMKQICDEIHHRWPEVDGIAMVQRTGRLLPGDVSVVIAIASSHRDTGIFDAARYGIDRLKEIVPIWKKEIGKNGEQWVEGDYYPKMGE